jgi:hypothetical protein
LKKMVNKKNEMTVRSKGEVITIIVPVDIDSGAGSTRKGVIDNILARSGFDREK